MPSNTSRPGPISPVQRFWTRTLAELTRWTRARMDTPQVHAGLPIRKFERVIMNGLAIRPTKKEAAEIALGSVYSDGAFGIWEYNSGMFNMIRWPALAIVLGLCIAYLLWGNPGTAISSRGNPPAQVPP